MNDQGAHFSSEDLQNIVREWFIILQLWQSHLTFLKVRILTITDPNIQRILVSNKAIWLKQIDHLANLEIENCYELINDHLAAITIYFYQKPISYWIKEHNFYRNHIQNLKSAYRKLVEEILKTINQA